MRDKFFGFSVRPWNYVDMKQFADSLCSLRAGVSCSFYCPYIASYHAGYKSGAYLNLSDKRYVSGFYHGVSGFYRTDETFRFNHA